MPKLIKEGKRDYYEFKLCQELPGEIIRYAIYIKIPVIERKWRDEEVKNNMMSKKPRRYLMRDIAECFDCGEISIEHLKAIRNFISGLKPNVRQSNTICRKFY